MVWKIGPACVAQQAKNVAASTMNGVEVSAAFTDMPLGPASMWPASVTAAGAGLTNSAAGTKSSQAPRPIVSCAARQSPCCKSQAANGDTVIGATPTPADTSDTARLRWLGTQALTAVIMGTKKLPAESPTSTP